MILTLYDNNIDVQVDKPQYECSGVSVELEDGSRYLIVQDRDSGKLAVSTLKRISIYPLSTNGVVLREVNYGENFEICEKHLKLYGNDYKNKRT